MVFRRPYISCSINNNPRTAKEIASIFHLDTTSATKQNAISIINEIENDMDNKEKTKITKTTPSFSWKDIVANLILIRN